MQRIITALMVVAVAFAAATSAQAQYTYTGPALATDSGLSCVGGTAADENKIDRSANWGATNHLTANGTYLNVFCPLRRRNTQAYGRAVGNLNSDSVLINKVTVFVRSSSTSGVLSCQVYAYSTYEDHEFETAPKYACNTNGGCTSKPANANYGFKQLVFDFPFGTSPMNGIGVVNIGYRCSIPNNWSRVIGAQAEFKSNHE